MVTILVVCIVLLLIVVAILLHRINDYRSQKDFYKFILEERIAHWKKEEVVWQEMQETISSATGGVCKRIDETREITEAICRHHFDLFKKESGLVFWLQANDEFLCQMRDLLHRVSDGRLASKDSEPVYPARYDAIHKALERETNLPE